VNATVTGTGTMTDLVALEPQLPEPRPGWYVRPRLGGITAHLTAGADTVHEMRRLALTVLLAYGVDLETARDAQLVLSELIGNAVRAGGAHVPLVVEVYTSSKDAVVSVHDPLAGVSPRRQAVAPGDPEAETGRGLVLLDVLAPGWTVTSSPVGKRIRCRIPAPAH